MKNIKTYIAIIILLASRVFSQSDFPKLTGPYLGQEPPGDSAVIFAPGIVSTQHHEHSRLVFSNDGNEIYWAVIPIETNSGSGNETTFHTEKQNIWFTRYSENAWTKPDILELTRKTDARSPSLSPDNRTLYFVSHDGNYNPSAKQNIGRKYSAKKVNSEWVVKNTVEDFIIREDGKWFMSFTTAQNGNIYFDYGGPDEKTQWQWQIYFLEYKDGSYAEPVLLQCGINDGVVDWCPWVAPDESYLIWSSHRTGNEGSGDLYISFKNPNGQWGTPVNMEKKINSPSLERFPSVSPDGKYLFFARNSDNKTYSDMYWIDAQLIKDLKESQ